MLGERPEGLVVLMPGAFACHVPDAARGIRFDDPRFGFGWPVTPAIVSDKDRKHPDYDPAVRRDEFRDL